MLSYPDKSRTVYLARAISGILDHPKVLKCLLDRLHSVCWARVFSNSGIVSVRCLPWPETGHLLDVGDPAGLHRVTPPISHVFLDFRVCSHGVQPFTASLPQSDFPPALNRVQSHILHSPYECRIPDGSNQGTRYYVSSVTGVSAADALLTSAAWFSVSRLTLFEALPETTSSSASGTTATRLLSLNRCIRAPCPRETRGMLRRST